jgi:hypothetical protein
MIALQIAAMTEAATLDVRNLRIADVYNGMKHGPAGPLLY